MAELMSLAVVDALAIAMIAFVLWRTYDENSWYARWGTYRHDMWCLIIVGLVFSVCIALYVIRLKLHI